MMKKLDIGLLVLSFLMIILIICSLRSEWQKLTIDVTLDKNKKEPVIIKRALYDSQTIISSDKELSYQYSVSWLKDHNCTTVTGLGAFSIILLFVAIVNLLKTHIKFLNSKFYTWFEKVGLATVLVTLFTFIAFLVSLKLEILTIIDGNYFTNKMVSHESDSEILLGNESMLVNLESTSTTGFHIMVATFVFSALYSVLTVLRFREITSPSSSIDYRFLYSGESSFLDDNEHNDGSDDTFPTATDI
ncbi:hypothetical protein RB653_009261 [Dictyostelium firmibasis]|uniref:Uncharacterized protein n=1 Tax=Dictyostelium firmibasis TaxID=79012 RepID=A0AAN7YX89_9MYCE